MEEQGDKGFVVRDRRKVGQEDEPKTEQQRPPQESREQKEQREARMKADFEEASRHAREGKPLPLPEVAFSTFVFSLSSSALVHLGEIPEPSSNEKRVDLPMAKQIIDTLGMLEEKTRGNLDTDEERLIRSVLYDLRLRFVQKSGG
jgi:hypothetical protein